MKINKIKNFQSCELQKSSHTDKIIKVRKDRDPSVVKFLTKMLKMILWLIGILLILSNLGYNVTSLIAGLGIGGIAIALALQNVLSDIFSTYE